MLFKGAILSFREDLYEKRSPSSTATTVVQTPIFIGMARQLYNVETNDGLSLLDLPNMEDGLSYNDSLTEGSLTYWKEVGNYTVESIDSLRSTLFVTQNSQNESIDFSKRVYTLFCIDTTTHNIIFTASLSSATFNYDGTFKLPISFTINESIPVGMNLISSDYTIYITYIDTVNLNAQNFVQHALTIYLTNLDSLFIFSDSSLSAYIVIKWNLYFDVIDKRYSVINIGDTIPDYCTNNKNNPIGQALAQHQLLSKTKVALVTIPTNNVSYIPQALEIIKTNELGYYIVPLFTNSSLPSFLLSEEINWKEDNTWCDNFLSYPMKMSNILAEGQVVSVNWNISLNLKVNIYSYSRDFTSDGDFPYSPSDTSGIAAILTVINAPSESTIDYGWVSSDPDSIAIVPNDSHCALSWNLNHDGTILSASATIDGVTKTIHIHIYTSGS